MRQVTLALMVLVFFIGCGKEIEYVTQIKEVEKVVPVYPNVPEIQCNFYKEKPEDVLNSLVECVIIQKKFIDSLKEH